jgi:hypothetical protein
MTLPASGRAWERRATVTSIIVVIDPFGIGRRAAYFAGSTAGRLGTRVVDAVAAALIRAGVAERAADELLDSGAIDRIVDRMLDSPLPQHVVDELLAGGIAEQVADRVLAGPELERIVESEALAAFAGRMLESRLLDQSVARVLASEQLWIVVEEVARSPAVTEAISHQSVGFAEEVVDQVGERSRRADAWLERVAQRMLHRSPTPPVGPAPPAPASP